MNDLIKRSDAIYELMDIIPYKFYRKGKYISLLDRKKCLATIKAIPTISKPQEKWIPCNKRLPGKYKAVLTTSKDGRVRENFITTCGWSYDTYAVVAWMPLPKPWKGADDET